MQPPQSYPPQPPAKNGFVKPLLIGCGVVLVVFIIAGGAIGWFAFRAVGTALHGASSVAQVAQNAASSAQQAAAQAGASPDAGQAAAEGAAVLKSLVNGGKGPVATLTREQLKADLPASVGSLARTNAESSSGSFSGISGTTASATYGGGSGGSISVDITDAANMAGLTTLMDVAMNISSEDDNGYEKTVQVGDVKVHEKWQNEGKHAELIGIVAGRFVVQVTGNGVDVGDDEKAFASVDTAKLAADAAAAKK
jgi:type II secretory pathway pseudopilin PulG